VIQPGELRHLVEVEAKQPPNPATPSANHNEFGERTPSYKRIGTAWTKIEPVSGRELERAKSFGADVSHKIKARYTPLITPAVRLRYGGRLYLVNAALNVDELNRELLIYATEYIGEMP
jgi:SPP1 family predicted phage head-tail adaptor